MSPHFNPRAFTRLDDAQQGRIVKAADNPRHWWVDALRAARPSVETLTPVLKRPPLGQLRRGAEARGVAHWTFGHNRRQADGVLELLQGFGMLGHVFCLAEPDAAGFMRGCHIAILNRSQDDPQMDAK